MPNEIDWAVRVIPLPREMRIAGAVTVRADEIHVLAPGNLVAPAGTAVAILRSFARGPAGSPCAVRMALTTDDGAALPDGLTDRLRALPNADQAYALLGQGTDDGGARRSRRTSRSRHTDLLLVANTSLGLLYAARTLQQLVSPPSVIAPETLLTLPLGEVVDWPDLAERGEWGGNSAEDLEWLERWKFNVVEAHSNAGCDDHGRPTISFDAAKVARAASVGIRMVPILSHLEQLPERGLPGWEDCYSTLSEERAQRSDSYPALCMSKPRTRELIALWLKEIAAIPGVRDIIAWLSEEATPCMCDDCRDQEPYDLEVAAVIAAFRQVQSEVSSDLRLRILTTQGSYPVNDRVLAAVPADVGVTYYDGGRTYDSSHAPMIYPLLEDFARRGRWLGVYPQVTNAWRSVLPWTGPQFIRTRMSEFASKGLSCVICYAVPSNRFHEFNVIAAAEWAWNHRGRTPREFARAYAHATGIQEVEGYAEWADMIGPIGWDVAGTRLFLNLIYNPSLGLDGAAPLDHRFEGGPEALSQRQIADDLTQAGAALAAARRIGLPEAIEETEITMAAIKLLRALYSLSRIPADASQLPLADREAVADALDDLDRCGVVLSTRLRQWGDRICQRTGTPMPDRLADTIHVVPRTAVAARDIIGRRLGVTGREPVFKQWALGEWSARDFAAGPHQTLTFDATAYITAPGDYVVSLDFTDSAHGMTPRKVSIAVLEGDACREVLCASDPLLRVSIWQRWRDTRVRVPQVVSGCRYLVRIEAEGPPADAPADRQTCAGKVSLRYAACTDAIADTFFTG